MDLPLLDTLFEVIFYLPELAWNPILGAILGVEFQS